MTETDLSGVVWRLTTLEVSKYPLKPRSESTSPVEGTRIALTFEDGRAAEPHSAP